MSIARSTGVQLFVFFCSSVPVALSMSQCVVPVVFICDFFPS